MPVSQKPRKTRVTPRGATVKTTRGKSPFRRAVTAAVIGILAGGLGLLSIFSLERNAQQAQRTSKTNLKVTTTLVDPPGGVPCPDTQGASEKRLAFPASGPPTCLIVGHTYKARISTDIGAFMVLLEPAKAPRSVNSFVVLARYHFYDDLVFHKAAPGFFIQSGDPVAKNVTGPGYVFDEAPPADSRAYVEGAVAMANQGKGKNGSQFLILANAAPTLPRFYPVFGQVIEGIDIVKRIAADGNTADAVPKDPPHRLLKVTIIETE